MIAEQNHGAHSALVDMRLIIDGVSLPITHMGPDFLILESSIEHPPGEATIVLKVDQNEDRWTVRLPDGLHAGQEHILISS